MKRNSASNHNRVFFLNRLMIAALVLASAVGCGTRQVSSDTDYTPSSSNSSSNVTSNECASASATIVAQNQSTTGTISIALGAELLWKVRATGCTGFKLVRPNNATVSFSSETFFNKAYSTAGTGITEIVTVQALNASGVVVKEIQAVSAPFNVTGSNAVANPLRCQAATNQPWINIPVNSSGQALQAPPIVAFTITSNRSSKIIAATAQIGQIVTKTGIPSSANAGIQVATAEVRGSGLNYIQFLVQDGDQVGQTAICSASVVLNPVVQGGGSGVSCTLTSSVSSVIPGQVFRLTVGVSGAVQTASIEGRPVTSAVPYIEVTATGARSYTAQVFGNGQSGTCSTQVTMGSVRVGMNFEDKTDNDYNDSVVCLEGAFSVDSAKRIVSQAHQVVMARATSISACNHDVKVRIRDQFGNATQVVAYQSASCPTFQLTFQPGWTMETEFFPRGACNMNRWISSSDPRVAVGNYCNTTGN